MSVFGPEGPGMPEDWSGEYAWLRSLGCYAGAVMLTPGGWFLVCASCEVARVSSDGAAGQADVAAHNVGAEHRAACRLGPDWAGRGLSAR